MLEHIVSKIVLDMTCPVCGGIQYVKPTKTVKKERVVCNNCKGAKVMYRDTNTLLLVPDASVVSGGVLASMKIMNIHVNEPADLEFERIYSYNVVVPDTLKAKEIHMYFD